MQISQLLQPSKQYQEVAQAFDKNSQEYLDQLIKQANVDAEANKQLYQKIYAQEKKCQDTNRKQHFFCGWKKFFICLMVLGIIGCGYAIFGLYGLYGYRSERYFSNKKTIFLILILIFSFLISLTSLLLNVCFFNKKIKNLTNIINQYHEKIEQLKSQAWEQMQNLNNLFGWSIAAQLFSKTLPLVQLDNNYSPLRYYQLQTKYGIKDLDKHSSILAIQSGHILNNPFILVKTFETIEGTETYTGSLTISWTETSIGFDGKIVTETHTEVLTASLTKFCPYYDTNEEMIYANESAPKLIFNRYHETANNFDHLIKKRKKEIDQISHQNSHFQKMSNEDFDALFYAIDRNNELQFRILFTPIAQQNMVDLIKTNPYGDYFNFRKNGPINGLSTTESLSFDFSTNPSVYQHFDLEKIKTQFALYNHNYFQKIYYTLAPILSIPEYQQHRPSQINENKLLFKHTITIQDVEALLNTYGAEKFAHEKTDSSIILKVSFINQQSNDFIENILLKCYSYEIIPHIDYVPTPGGDGKIHPVPVHWDEYIPLYQERKIKLFNYVSYLEKNQNISKNELLNKYNLKCIYEQKGLWLVESLNNL